MPLYVRVNNTALAVVADADRPPQRPGVDQDRNDCLRHADQRQHEKFGVVEDPEVSDAGCCKSEEQHLKGRNPAKRRRRESSN